MSRFLPLSAGVLLAAAALTACTSSSGGGAPTKTPSGSSPVVGPQISSSNSAAPTTANSRPKSLATFTAVKGTATTLHFDAAFVRALYTHGVSTSATGSAKLVAVPNTSNAVLPITAGSATVYKSAAKSTLNLQHDTGGLAVTSDAGAIRITDIALRLGSKPTVTSRLVAVSQGTVSQAQPIQLFQLKPTAAYSATVHKGVVTVSGVRLYLTPSASKIFDRALGIKIFAGSTPQFVGTLTTVVRRA